MCDAVGGVNGLTQGVLQGLAAKNSTTQILLRANSWSRYLTFIKMRDVKVSEADQAGNAWTLASLMSYYAPMLDGYILCASDLATESASVAVSLSGILNAVVVTPDNEQRAKDAGLQMVIDVTDKDDAWLRESEYFNLLAYDVAVEQPVTMAPKLVDYAAMAGAYCYYYNGNVREEHAKQFEFLDDGAVVIGWNGTLGEYETVYSLSEENACLIPADHAYNLSTLSSFAGEGKLNEKQYADKDSEKAHIEDEAKHTVCFVMSDGDNLQWMLNDYCGTNWFGSPLRGQFPMTWGLPALAGELALPMVEYFKQAQTGKDEFIMQLSGLGYTFPSKWDARARDDMAERLADAMADRGFRYLNILDDHGFTEENMASFTQFDDTVQGIFYTDYGNYAGYEGKILWSNDVPVVAARYRLWAGLEDGSLENIAKSINKATANVYNEDAYSFIIVHAWSGVNANGELVSGGNTMNAVEKLIGMFDEDVEVVSASEFMNRVRENLMP